MDAALRPLRVIPGRPLRSPSPAPQTQAAQISSSNASIMPTSDCSPAPRQLATPPPPLTEQQTRRAFQAMVEKIYAGYPAQSQEIAREPRLTSSMQTVQLMRLLSSALLSSRSRAGVGPSGSHPPSDRCWAGLWLQRRGPWQAAQHHDLCHLLPWRLTTISLLRRRHADGHDERHNTEGTTMAAAMGVERMPAGTTGGRRVSQEPLSSFAVTDSICVGSTLRIPCGRNVGLLSHVD